MTSFRLAPVRPRSLCWVVTLGSVLTALWTVEIASGSGRAVHPAAPARATQTKAPNRRTIDGERFCELFSTLAPSR